MKPEQQQIAIAQALNWTDLHGGESDGGLYLRGHPPGNKGLAQPVPNYPFNLNAMHEAEIWLKAAHPHTYGKYSNYILTYYSISALAAQRAEAFLKTLNLWTS